MTPEDSQSSEDLVNSEGSHTASPSSSSNTDPPIRVRNVAEINSTEAEGILSQQSKTKPPSWMFLATHRECSSSPKRRRLASTNDDDAPCASTSQAALRQLDICVTHSTSSDDIQEDTQQTASTSDTRPVSNHDEEASTSCEIVENEAEAEIKAEPGTEFEPVPSTSRGFSTPTRNRLDNVNEDGVRVVGEILPPSPDIKPAKEVQKEEATSSTARPTCQYGIRCTRYRHNPAHRHEEAHPGDPDYRRPDYPPAPDGAPDCPFGVSCYRRNPVHFQQYKHPPTTDFEQNWRNYKMRLRTRRQRDDPNANHPSSSSMQDSSAESDDEPIFNDESEEFVPNEEDEEDEEEEEDDDEYV